LPLGRESCSYSMEDWVVPGAGLEAVTMIFEKHAVFIK
jgi:hypothetical protein